MSAPPVSDWYEVADPVIRGIVRRKLRVSLSEGDSRRNNQKAFDVVQNIYLELTKAINAGGDEISDIKSYAAVVSYHQCAEYIRDLYPGRVRLQNKIHYFLTHKPGFAVWESKDGDIYCGFAGWTAKEAAAAEAVNLLSSDPSKLSQANTRANAVKSLDSMKGADWRNLAEGIFEFLDGPIELDDLVAIACSMFRVKDEPREAAFEPFVRPRVDDDLHHQDMMQKLWRILQDLDRRWLLAFFLNLPGFTKEARGEIEAFEESKAANRRQIGSLLGLTFKEYAVLRAETPQLPSDPGSAESRMEMLWQHLPLEDLPIAKVLECQKQQVINFRALVVQKAAKRLKLTISPAR